MKKRNPTNYREKHQMAHVEGASIEFIEKCGLEAKACIRPRTFLQVYLKSRSIKSKFVDFGIQLKLKADIAERFPRSRRPGTQSKKLPTCSPPTNRHQCRYQVPLHRRACGRGPNVRMGWRRVTANVALLDQQRKGERGIPRLPMLSFLGHDLFLSVSDISRRPGSHSYNSIDRPWEDQDRCISWEIFGQRGKAEVDHTAWKKFIEARQKTFKLSYDVQGK